jgi:lycopene cyclase domain-containing protein
LLTYFGVLSFFVVPLLLAVAAANLLLDARGAGPRPWIVVGGLALLAVVYTTPWDNYLVASGVWSYDSRLVTGPVFGWVPAEEYAFFVLQTLMTGLWTALLLRLAGQPGRFVLSRGIRSALAAAVLLAAIVSAGLLASGWQSGRYLALILVWALPPVAGQLAFGADIILARGRVLAVAILAPTAWLWVTDAAALGRGVWAIDPAQSTGLAWGVLPLEEMVFFLMTNLMVAAGTVLLLSPESGRRVRAHLDSHRK